MSIVPIHVQNGTFVRTKQYIMAKLGNPFLGVSLDEAQLNICIEDALEMFYHYSSETWDYMVLDYWIFQTEPDRAVYDLHSCIDQAKIRSVIYNPQNYSLFNIAFNQNFDFLFFTTADQMPDLATFYMAMMKQELVNKVLGQEGTFAVVGSPPKLHLIPTPQGVLNVGVMFSKLPDIETLEKIGIIRRLALAKAKMILGEILTRYSSIPGGMGEISMNGSELKAEGKEEEQTIIEDMRLRMIFLPHTDYE